MWPRDEGSDYFVEVPNSYSIIVPSLMLIDLLKKEVLFTLHDIMQQSDQKDMSLNNWDLST